MSTNLPFSPITGATAGKTVKVTGNATPTSVAGTVDCTSNPANNIRVYNDGTVLVFVRATAEATPAATNADIPLATKASIVIANPVANGKTGVAVLSSTASSNDVYFTPGEGGS